MNAPGSSAFVYLLLVTIVAWMVAILIHRVRRESIRAKAAVLVISTIIALEVAVLLIMWIVSDLIG